MAAVQNDAALAAAYVELLTENERLWRELQLAHDQAAAAEWKRMQERFHGFDAIRNDACPCCGGPVVVVEEGSRVYLQARR